jgi:hypothetical protein
MNARPSPLQYLEPMCGLCNRLRAIDGAATLAEELGSRLVVLWYADRDLNCRFEDLYQPLPPPVQFRTLSLPGPVERATKRLIHALARRTCDAYMVQLEAEALARTGHDFSAFVRRGRTYLKTWSRIHPTPRPFTRFRLQPHLAALLDHTTRGFERVVGVHIRRTDCHDAIARSTTGKFIAAMDAELTRDPGVRFFVATDDPREEALLSDRYPGRILTHPKRTRARHRREGIEDAVIDLHALGRCRTILGSHSSSFSETAVDLCPGGGPYVT